MKANPLTDDVQITVRKPESEAGLAATHGSGVPDGYQLLAQTDIICAGDIVADCEGKWRGPVPHDWPGCGCLVSEYTVSKSDIGLPAVRGVARKHLPSESSSPAARETPK